ncbi:hypothetical protein WICPIJ_003626 [Wickerhamomyces pijperi]|uniref:Uncharacterized protein n=1 Tax=Wickerhamomyces pijperi TaxID=599730 RepID=A0A9P8Q721_WICPI|nr:hypothetical protein WICPIJ_003626 [Wickerhamomyces pijperi]
MSSLSAQITKSSSLKSLTSRLFTTSSLFQSTTSKTQTTNTNIINSEDNEIDLQKALDLLSSTDLTKSSLLSKLSSSPAGNMTESEKLKYINYFAKVLNTDIKETKQNDRSYNEHFTQSLMGLNQLLSSSKPNTASRNYHPTSIITEFDNKSAKSSSPLLTSSRQELISKFDSLINTDNLSLRSFSVILAKIGTDYENLNYVLTKINFMNRDHRYDSFKILICSKAMQLTSSNCKPLLNALVQDMKEKDLTSWIQLRNEGKLNKVLEKSLYQILYKLSKQDLTNTLQFTPYQFILLIEALPFHSSLITQVYHQENHSQSDHGLVMSLSSNQTALYKFSTFLTNNREIISSGKPTSLQRKLVKLSIDNHIHKEQADTANMKKMESSLTVHQYRFRNGLTEILESLQDLNVFSQKDLAGLTEILETNSEVVYKETVLKFI